MSRKLSRSSYKDRQGFQFVKVVPKFLQKFKESSGPSAPWESKQSEEDAAKERPVFEDEKPVVVSLEDATPSAETSEKSKKSEKFFQRLKMSIDNEKKVNHKVEPNSESELSAVVPQPKLSFLNKKRKRAPGTPVEEDEEVKRQKGLKEAAAFIQEEVDSIRHEAREKEEGKFLFRSRKKKKGTVQDPDSSATPTAKQGAAFTPGKKANRSKARKTGKPKKSTSAALLSFSQDDEDEE